jgi:hypothetical protein
MMPPELIIPAISLIVGFCASMIGVFVGMKVGLSRLEVHKDYMRERMSGMNGQIVEMVKREALREEDVRILDFEMEDVMRNLDLPRKKRQNWRFDT